MPVECIQQNDSGDSLKKCSKCKRDLPADKFHFYSASNTKDKLYSSCKECAGHKFSKPRAEIPDGHSMCNKCGRILPATLDYFYRRKNGSFGLRSECKTCEAIRNKNHSTNNPNYKAEYHNEHKLEESKYGKQYYEINKDRISTYASLRYKNKKDELLAKTKKYYQENKERYRENYKQYREINKTKEKERISMWQKNNKEKGSLKAQRYRAKKNKLASSYSEEEWSKCKNSFNNECCYCGEGKPLAQEHFVPVDKGGPYVKENIIPACKSCNSSKINHDFFTWYPKQPFYSPQREAKILDYLGYSQGAQQLSLM